MPRPASKYPTDLELQILKVLWRIGPATVRQVQDELATQRNLAYTSVITMLNIMTRKKYLARKSVGGSFIDQPRVTERTTSSRLLRDLVNRVFGGSAVDAVLQLLDDRELDESEMRKLRELVQRKTQREEP